MNTPFAQNKSKRKKELLKAEEHIQKAIIALQAAKENANHWADFETIGFFEKQLIDFLSIENNQAGFQPFALKQ